MKQGNWKTPWTDKFAKDGSKEGNAYQWTWFVPHDVHGLIDLMGESTFIKELDEFFAGSSPTFPPGAGIITIPTNPFTRLFPILISPVSPGGPSTGQGWC